MLYILLNKKGVGALQANILVRVFDERADGGAAPLRGGADPNRN